MPFLFGFLISTDLCNGFPRANESSLVLSLLVVAGISASVTVSGDEYVREVDEVEELVEKQVRRMVHDLMCRNELSCHS